MVESLFEAGHQDVIVDATIKRTPGKFLKGTIEALPVRKILKATCQKYGYESTSAKQVASYYWKGKLVAQHLRGKDKQFAWIGDVSKLELYGQHLWQSGGKRLVITEGEVDAAHSMSYSYILTTRLSAYRDLENLLMMLILTHQPT